MDDQPQTNFGQAWMNERWISCLPVYPYIDRELTEYAVEKVGKVLV
jgi:hypothetical protein